MREVRVYSLGDFGFQGLALDTCCLRGSGRVNISTIVGVYMGTEYGSTTPHSPQAPLSWT